MDPAYPISRERDDMVGIALHDPLESVTNPDDFHSVQLRANCRRRDDAVDARRRTTAHQNCKLTGLIHELSLYESELLMPANVINSATSRPILLQLSFAIRFVQP